MRGWTVQDGDVKLDERGYPAHAGMGPASTT